MTAKIVSADKGWNNYHTHTFRCHHATGDVEDFARLAQQKGMKKLGMSDHAHVQGEGDHPMHMSKRDIPEYVRLCRECDGKFGGIRVLCGVECDYDPSDENYFRDYYLIYSWKKSNNGRNDFWRLYFIPKLFKSIERYIQSN